LLRCFIFALPFVPRTELIDRRQKNKGRKNQ
jgi:hypothetical protein